MFLLGTLFLTFFEFIQYTNIYYSVPNVFDAVPRVLQDVTDQK